MQNKNKKLEQNLLLLKLHRIDVLLFAGAIFVAYQMHTVGLSLTQILIGESIFALTILIFEIPSGVFSDLVSRKITLLITEYILLLGCSVFAFAQNFIHIIISQIIFGIAMATQSGTDSSMLFDTLKALGREKEHKKVLGGITFFFLVVLAIGQSIGGFLAGIDLRLPMIICIPIVLIRIVIVARLTEPPRQKSKHKNPFLHTKSAIKWLFSHRIVSVLALATVIIALGRKISMHTLNPYMEIIEVPIIYWGVLLAAFNIVAAFIAREAHNIEKKIGSVKSFILIFGFWTLGFILLAKVHIFLAFMWPILHWTIRPFTDIFFSDEINKRTESHQRATVLSISNFCSQFLQMLALPVLGYAADIWSLETMYLLMAAILFVAGVVIGVMLYSRRIKS